MDVVFAWSGFVGAWLLVAGPLFQAAVDLDGSGERREEIVAAARQVGPQPRMSPWWWLLPPVAYVRQRRVQGQYRQRVFDALSRSQTETFIEFSNVSTGWALVALGACFIGVKETWELVEVSEWPGWLLPVLVVVMLAACAVNTVVRIRRSHQMLDAHAVPATGAPAPEPAP